YPKTQWKIHPPTAASPPRPSAAASDASSSPTSRSRERALQSPRKKSRAARIADLRPSTRQHNLPTPPTHKESPPPDSSPPPPASVPQIRQSVFPDPSFASHSFAVGATGVSPVQSGGDARLSTTNFRPPRPRPYS